MTCSCLADIDEKLGPEHFVNATMAFRVGEVSRPIINLIRRDTWKPETRRSKTSFIVASFCPFCGTKIDSNDAKETA